MNVTTKMIADALGLSRITVDRALNMRSGISEKRRQEVLAAAKEMGYRPHRLAQALVNGVSKSLGIIVFDLNSAFFAQLVDSFQNAAFEMGYVSYIMLTNKNPEVEKACLEHLLDRRVDAIILDSVISDEDYAEYIRNLKIPVVSVMNRISADQPLISIDNYRAMLDMTRYIISKGYQNLVYVCPPLYKAGVVNMSALVDRKDGFMEAVRSARFPVETVLLEDEGYLQAICELRLQEGARTAVICTSDVYAVAIMNVLQKRGFRPPIDYGLSGFDNIPMLHEFEPNITTVSLRIRNIGTKCASLLIDAINGKELPSFVEMPYEIISGQTIL